MFFKLKIAFYPGQSLIEVIVSIGVAVMLAISLITTSLITQKSSRSAKNNTQATKIVQQTLEQLRVLRDRKGFEEFDSFTDGPCVAITNVADINPGNWNLGTSSCPEEITLDNTDFSRSIDIDSDGVNKVLITVTVSWDESGQIRSVKSQTVLGLWEE